VVTPLPLARSRLVEEKHLLSEELRRERDLQTTHETQNRVARGKAEGLEQELTLARQKITELEVERKASSERIATLTGQSKGLAKECEGLREQLAAQKIWISEQTSPIRAKGVGDRDNFDGGKGEGIH
jgi:chromosome segregation ATPase